MSDRKRSVLLFAAGLVLGGVVGGQVMGRVAAREVLEAMGPSIVGHLQRSTLDGATRADRALRWIETADEDGLAASRALALEQARTDMVTLRTVRHEYPGLIDRLDDRIARIMEADALLEQAPGALDEG